MEVGSQEQRWEDSGGQCLANEINTGHPRPIGQEFMYSPIDVVLVAYVPEEPNLIFGHEHADT